MLLDQDPGPYDQLRDIVPAEVDSRDGSRYWFVATSTHTFTVFATGLDQARAIVLVELGYTFRPWLASELSARPASAAEISTVDKWRGSRALRVNTKTSKKKRRAITLVARMLNHADTRAAGENAQDLGAGSPARRTGKRRRVHVQHGDDPGLTL